MYKGNVKQIFMSKKNTWTEDEISVLKENYPKYGLKVCLELINYSPDKIRRMSHKLGLKIDKDKKEKYKGKSNIDCNINPDLFYNINQKEVVYLLGLMWSDGFLNKTKNCSTIGIKMVSEDMDTLLSSLNKIGKWNIYKRNILGNKPTTTISTNNKRIYDFLIENDYNDKSFKTANKILSRIPHHLISYFFRGVIDGDGCFYFKKQKNTYLRQLTIASTYEQDWSYVEDLFKKMNIKYSIKKIKRLNSSYSIIRITNKDGIKKIGEFIYANYNFDKIGLKRKNDKFMKIVLN